jgi:bacterioferritin
LRLARHAEPDARWPERGVVDPRRALRRAKARSRRAPTKGHAVKGSQDVIDLLNEVLAGELVAINQYFLHAKMCKNWGFEGLAAKIKAESIDEMRHADQIAERILFLEGLPNFQRLDKINIGQTVPEQMRSDLDAEYRAVKRLNDGIKLCREQGDATSEVLLKRILESEEEHIDWLETQLSLIETLGDKAYLAEQLK